LAPIYAENISCDICDEIFEDRKELMRHIQTMHIGWIINLFSLLYSTINLNSFKFYIACCYLYGNIKLLFWYVSKIV